MSTNNPGGSSPYDPQDPNRDPKSWGTPPGDLNEQPTAMQPSGQQYGEPAYGGGQNGQAQQYGQQDGQGYGAPQDQYGQQGQYGQNTYGQQPGSNAPAYGQGQYAQGDGGQPMYGDQQGYGAPAYDQSQYGAPAAPAGQYASWWSRVGAYLIDRIIASVPLFVLGAVGLGNGSMKLEDQLNGDPQWVISGGGWTLLALGWLAALAISIWNEGYRQGTTTQSIGKKLLNIAVVDHQNGRPLGTGRGIGRILLDLLWNLPSSLFPALGIVPLINYLWPLWDSKKQTWSDKIVKSIVVKKLV